MARTKKQPVKHTDQRKRPLVHSEKPGLGDNTQTKNSECATVSVEKHQVDSNQKCKDPDNTELDIHETTSVKKSKMARNTASPLNSYSCSQCYMAFSECDFWRKHMKRMHYDKYLELQKDELFSDCLPDQTKNLDQEVSGDAAGLVKNAGDVTEIRQQEEKPSACLIGCDTSNAETCETQDDSGVTLKDKDSGIKLSSDGEKCIEGFDGEAKSKTKTDLRKGMEEQMDEKPYKCDVCGAGFSHSGNVQRHKRVHVGVKLHNCKTCGVGFTSIHMRDTHERLHTGEKPYKCSICGVGFTRKGYLNIHKRIHTGEKPYKCDVCGAGFTQCGHLQTHKRIHTGEKPFVCGMCGAGFTQCGHLQTHKRLHTGEKPYICDVCGAGFIQCGHLQTHKRKHTGEKPYKCDICGAGFTQCGHLQSHKKLHAGDKAYSHVAGNDKFAQDCKLFISKIGTENKLCFCEYCGQSFSYKSSLQRHRKMHMREKSHKDKEYNVGFSDGASISSCGDLHAESKPELCDVDGIEFYERESRQTHRRSDTVRKSFMHSIYGDSYSHIDVLSLDK